MLILVAGLLATAAPGGPVREAIVIASNHPLPGSNYDVLRYADDDALRFAEFFEDIGVSTTLMTVPDAETVARYGEVADRALRPTRAGVLKALDDVRQRLAAAADRPRELYFVFSGHGSVTSSRAYLHLLDGPFSRTDLFSYVLRVMPADRIHIVIDSCHSYFLVNARGERVVAVDSEDVDRFPHVGFLLSTSERREVQEWDGYRAGVFSYQVLGALRGAADVDRDRQVTYPEVHAYVMAANLTVKNPSARIQPYVRRPGVRGDALVDLRGAEDSAAVEVDSRLAGHFVVVDDERGRVLDAHKPGDESLVLLLDPDRPLIVRQGETTYRVATSTPYAVLEPAPALAVLSKGSPADEFRTNLFKTPLTRDFVRGLDAVTRQTHPPRVVRQPSEAWDEDPVTLGLLSSGSAAVLFAGVATGLFIHARHVANGSLVRSPDESDVAFRARIRDQDAASDRASVWQGVMIGAYAAGGGMLLGSLLYALTATDEDPLSVGAIMGSDRSGFVIQGRF